MEYMNWANDVLALPANEIERPRSVISEIGLKSRETEHPNNLPTADSLCVKLMTK